MNIELDKVLGQYIKVKNTTTEGGIYCVSSLLIYPKDKIEAGHLIKRGNLRTRWYEFNVWPQSYYYNRFVDKADLLYLQNMEMIYGENFKEDLLALPDKKYYSKVIKELLETYREKLRNLKPDPYLGQLTEKGRILWKDPNNRYIVLTTDKKLNLL